MSVPSVSKNGFALDFKSALKKRKAAFRRSSWARCGTFLSQSEEGCHSASFLTLIHLGHHLLFYKDGGFGGRLALADWPARA